MRRMTIWIAAVATLASGVTAYAASAGGLNAGDLGAGDGAVNECDNSFTHSFTTSGGNVTSVTVADIAAGCSGGQLSVTLTNGAGAAIGAGGSVGAIASSVDVPVSPQPSAPTVAGIHIVVVGP